MITTNTRIVAVGGSLILLLFIIELVRRRRLKEEYSVLWVATAIVLLILSVWYDLLVEVTELIGGVAPSSTLFFFGLLFVFFMLLHFSVRTSQLERRLTSLIQEIGILSAQRPPERTGHTEELEAEAVARAAAHAEAAEAQGEREPEGTRVP